jgi:hypothetical protein
MTRPFNYDRDFWALIGPDAEKVDAPCSNDKEHVRQVFRGLCFGFYWRFVGKPNCEVIAFNPVSGRAVPVTDDWFEELCAEELAEERRPLTRAEHEGNLADNSWKERV